MNIEDIRLFCLKKPKSSEEFPFDEDTLVFKVLRKIFSSFPFKTMGGGPALNYFKCDPEYAIELRENYSCIVPGFHANKKHWNTIHLETNEIPQNCI